MFIKYAEKACEFPVLLLTAEVMDYHCHIIPFIMASVYNQRVKNNVNDFLDYKVNPVNLSQIKTSNPRHILFSGNSVEELAKAADFFGLPFDKLKVCDNYRIRN
ncbi:hypothetical protein J4429_03875 [Candidatus Pacearchaeota archaeon]|nr:hypothetical protein [Candidatus Pacearchaeota archaeon]